MKEVYFKPHSSRQKEFLFFKTLIKNYPDIKHIEENYLLPISHLDKKINVRNIEQKVLKSDQISIKKKQSVLESLATLPEEVLVAKKISDVSVDFVFIDKNDEIIFIEFHEKQHRNLSVSRATPIFDEFGNRHEIPRYSQRLLKDIWRVENLTNFKIIWWDWFDLNPNITLEKITKNLENEFNINQKFSFQKLLK